jgi:hypothetical protein
MRDIIAEAQRRFATCDQLRADQEERIWLTVWAGKQWGDQAPNRLFGSWLNELGEAL